jgi:ABC-type antimicrobial peptide transport system permease subunit
VFYLRYLFAELLRRKSRTLLTSLGLAVGVGMVATVSALSNGLGEAQSKVLTPLSGVGTDMSVTRPLALTADEQLARQRENAPARLDMQAILSMRPGSRFSRDSLIASGYASFPESEGRAVAGVEGVEAIAPALTLTLFRATGTVPDASELFGGRATGMVPAGIEFNQQSISGVDPALPELAPVSPEQIVDGRYFATGARAEQQAVVSEGYAKRQQLGLGDTLTVRGRTFTVIGVARQPLGGYASDIYVRLGVLQTLSGREGRINVLRARTGSATAVASVADAIERSFAGSRVTTAQDLADRVSGSLKDSKSLADRLGTALAAVALAAAILIASLLTLSSVAKRTRELGTLKAIGWGKWLVIRQVAGEALAQGLLGGLLGAAIALVGTALISAFAPTLEATVEQIEGAPMGAIGQGQVAAGSTTVTLSAPINAATLVAAIALAVLGGLIAGMIGAARAARLRPAQALRSIE